MPKSFVSTCKHCGQDFIDWIQGETMCESCANERMQEYAEADAYYDEMTGDYVNE